MTHAKDTTNDVSNKVLGRIKKMLALGNDAAATEHERDTALKMAYNLLAKHNLTTADLPADQNNEAREGQDFVMSADTWARSLCQTIGSLFFSKYYFSRMGAGKDGHHFIGRQSNVVTAAYMSEFIIRGIKKEASKRYKSPTSPEGRSFCVGAVQTIRQRVAELQKEDTESVPGSALALVKLSKSEAEANDAFALTLGTSIVKSKPRADNSLRAGAFYDGKAFGKSVSLAQQVGATPAPKRTKLN